MNIALQIAVVLVGLGLAGWFALIAHDVHTDYRRFTKLVDRRPDVKQQKSDRHQQATSPGDTTKRRPKELV